MAGFLDKILGSFKTNKSVLGVDISSSSIKVVQIRKEKGAAVLETYGELALGPYTGLDRGQSASLPTSKMIGALKDLLKEAKVTTKNCGVAIPMTASLINVIEMPNLDKKRLDMMIPIEMRKYIPVPISEVIMDWRPIPKEFAISTPASTGENKEKDLPTGKKGKKSYLGRQEIFVVAIHKEVIENYSRIIQDVGLNASFFEIEIFSTIRTISTKPGESIMIIDFGSGSTKIYVIESGIVRDSHVIGRGSQNISISLSRALGISMEQAERMKRENGLLKEHDDTYQISSLVVNSIFSEANKVLLNYQKKYNKTVSKIILTGGGSTIKGLIDVANKELVSSVIISDPFSNLRYPAFLAKILKLAGPEFAVAIGVALRKIDE